MNTMTRCALLSCALLAAVVLDRGHPAQAAAAETESAVARPDFSGVWLPNSKASGRWPGERPFTPAMANLRAQRAKAEFSHVVLNRKGTIAMGIGQVNGGKRDFSAHGL